MDLGANQWTWETTNGLGRQPLDVGGDQCSWEANNGRGRQLGQSWGIGENLNIHESVLMVFSF